MHKAQAITAEPPKNMGCCRSSGEDAANKTLHLASQVGAGAIIAEVGFNWKSPPSKKSKHKTLKRHSEIYTAKNRKLYVHVNRARGRGRATPGRRGSLVPGPHPSHLRNMRAPRTYIRTCACEVRCHAHRESTISCDQRIRIPL